MSVYAGSVQDLIDELGRLPGVGPKSAQRIAFHLLNAILLLPLLFLIFFSIPTHLHPTSGPTGTPSTTSTILNYCILEDFQKREYYFNSFFFTFLMRQAISTTPSLFFFSAHAARAPARRHG